MAVAAGELTGKDIASIRARCVKIKLQLLTLALDVDELLCYTVTMTNFQPTFWTNQPNIIRKGV